MEFKDNLVAKKYDPGIYKQEIVSRSKEPLRVK